MNEHLQPKRILSYLFILAIAFLFAVQWGPGSRGCEAPLTRQSSETAATVNGKGIPMSDFRRAYGNQINYMRQQGSPITEQLARQLGFHKQIAEQLVQVELLAQAAEKQGIRASDEEIREIIHRNPSFQKDGRFDYDTYRQTLRDFYRRTHVDFEEEPRRQLAGEKLLEVVEGGAMVSDDEVKARYFREGNRAAATFVRFLPAMAASKVAAPKPGEVEAWAKANPKEISDHYEANRFLYHQPERVRARHVLIKVDREAPQDKQDEAKAKIDNLRKELEGGKDFAQVAKEFSEDTGSKQSGGDLGFNERAAWVPEFSEAAFGLKVGELSQPVRSQFGWHLIKVDEKKPPESKELKDVELEIAKQLWTKAQAKELARAEANKTLEAVKAGKKLAELHPPNADTQANAYRFQAESKPEAIETGEFSATTDSLPQLGPAPELVKAIFARPAPGPMEELHPTAEGFAVVVVTDRKRPSEEDFAKQREQLKAEAIQGKRYELRDAFLKALKKQGSVVINEEAIANLG
ncbi:MAG: SurA N-terminal domain-containing protein [Myxococcales bacterium]|nr:SurA N-terminal domain-containing protein [Myxococcales bacterium]